MGFITLESVQPKRALILEFNYLRNNLESINYFSPRTVLLLSRYARTVCAEYKPLPSFLETSLGRLKLHSVLQQVMDKMHYWLYFKRYGKLFRSVVDVIVNEDGTEIIDLTGNDTTDSDSTGMEFELESPYASPFQSPSPNYY